MNPTEEFEIYQFLCKEAEAYVSLSQLLKDAHLTMEAASSAVADFRKQFQDGLQHWQISNQNPAAISLGLLQALQEHPGDSQLSFLYAAWITDRGLLFDWHPENRSEEQDIRVWLKQSKTVSEFQAFYRNRQYKKHSCRFLNKQQRSSNEMQKREQMNEMRFSTYPFRIRSFMLAEKALLM